MVAIANVRGHDRSCRAAGNQLGAQQFDCSCLAMCQEKASRDGMPVLNPSNKAIAISVPGIAIDLPDPGLNDDRATPHAHTLCAIEDSASQRAGRLKSYEEDRRVRTRQIMPEVMPDAAALAHTRRSQDDRSRGGVERDRIR